MAPFSWRLGETNRFVIRSEVHSNKTAYTAWIFDQSQAGWRKLATFRTRTSGRNLRGYYSFVEDFRRDTRSVGEVRRARFGAGWVRNSQGEWIPLSAARFTASGASWESKENIDAGIDGESFYLVTGGATQRTIDLRTTLRRPARAGSVPPPHLPF